MSKAEALRGTQATAPADRGLMGDRPAGRSNGSTPRDGRLEDAEALAAARLRCAVDGLRRARPDLSASGPLAPWQKIALLLAAACLAGGSATGERWLALALALLALPFLAVALLRIVALRQLGRPGGHAAPPGRSADMVSELPVYSILVPLYREAAVVGDLVRALSALDYPADRLDIVFIVEAEDEKTRTALAACGLEPPMRVLTVPEGEPRTKPRALNFALLYARGDYVVIYDAEDEPEPDQLHLALAAFAADPDRLGCVQARLDIYNADESWLTRQFTIEYAALFHAILPALDRLELPVPLGGTSNHFPRRVLECVGGWDPFNVTEDADLGIRLTRAGWRIGVLESTTREEAPEALRVWLKQRTRWLKGWMQTYLVHMRAPLRLWRELGPRRFIGFQVLMGGVVLSALVHPWFYVLAAADLWSGHGWQPPPAPAGQALWWLAILNLLLGYAAAIALGIAAAARRGRLDLARHALLMPIYWLAISFAAYRALLQLVTAPHRWEKTEHRARVKGRT